LEHGNRRAPVPSGTNLQKFVLQPAVLRSPRVAADYDDLRELMQLHIVITDRTAPQSSPRL